MSSVGRLIDRRLAKTLVLLQALMIPIIGGVAWIVFDGLVAKSAVCGAIICWLASSYFAWQSFRVAGATASRQILENMSKGMIGKFVIVSVGFIIVLTSVKPLSVLALFCGFILIQSMAWFVPMVLARFMR